MFYTVYKTINIHNQKFYIGVHKTIDPNDDYLGSGKLIKFAIKKYGKASFKKTILFIFDHREEAYLKERELVTPELMISDACYNLARGGSGGFDYLNLNKLNKGNKDYKELGKRGRAATIKQYGGSTIPRQNSKEAIEKRTATRKITIPNGSWFGKRHTVESKQKMSEAAKLRSGVRNSQFGTIWITDGTINKKLNKNDPIPHGWYKGRIIKTDIKISDH